MAEGVECDQYESAQVSAYYVGVVSCVFYSTSRKQTVTAKAGEFNMPYGLKRTFRRRRLTIVSLTESQSGGLFFSAAADAVWKLAGTGSGSSQNVDAEVWVVCYSVCLVSAFA